jgi:hypothetical protein
MNFELTQSSLKDFINLSREDWKAKWIDKTKPYERNSSFIYGSLLDGFLFDPDCLPKRFITYKGKDKVSDKLQEVIGLAVTKKDTPIKQALLESCKQLDYGNTWKEETILKRFEGLDDYISFCTKNSYKTVLYPQYVREIQAVAEYLVKHTDNQIYKYIVAEPGGDYINNFQQTLRGTIHGIPCKIILDILHYDEANSTVKNVDFKTTYDTQKFKESIYKYGYDVQASFYQEILKQNSDLHKFYTLLPPMNIAVAKKDLDIYIHEFSESELENAKNGTSEKRGWLSILDEIGEYLNDLQNENKRSKS